MAKFIYVVNVCVVAAIIFFEFTSDSDKTIVLAYALYIVLFAMNVMLGLFSHMESKSLYKHYYISAIFLAIAGIFLTMQN
jgi:hypothetical protein